MTYSGPIAEAGTGNARLYFAESSGIFRTVSHRVPFSFTMLKQTELEC